MNHAPDTQKTLFKIKLVLEIHKSQTARKPERDFLQEHEMAVE